jgi:PAS domain S-box-containing protein
MDNEFYRRLVDKIPAMVAVYNITTGKYLYVNSSIKSLLGYSPSTFMKKGLIFANSLVHPEDVVRISQQNQDALARVNNPVYAQLAEKAIVQFEYRMRHKNGSWVWMKTDGMVFGRGEDGKVNRVLNISINITDRRNAEDELKKLSAKLEAKVSERTQELAESMQDLQNLKYALDQSSIVAITDHSGMIQYVNDKLVEISGYNREELVGKTHRVLNSKYHPHEFMKNLWKTILSGNVWHGEICNRAKSGKYYWVDTTIVPLPDQFIAIRNDITERKELEQKKDEFISVASHELKTPLTTAKAYVQVLERLAQRQHDARFLTYINRMKQQIERLTVLVFEMLDTTKIQSGRLKLNNKKFNISTLIREVCDDIAVVHPTHVINFETGKGCYVDADWNRMDQVIHNLMVNAIKYSPKKTTIDVVCTQQKKQVVF